MTLYNLGEIGWLGVKE